MCFLQGHKAQLGIAAVFALRNTSVAAGLVILGDMNIQGNIKAISTLTEPMQIAMGNGAR